MTYTEKIYYFKSKVKNYTKESTKWLFDKIRNPDNKFKPCTLSDLHVGGFYYMIYDFKGVNKSSKMEQNVPFMVVDYNPNIDKKVLYILNMNFITLIVKEAMFSKLTEIYSSTMESNTKSKNVDNEYPFSNINYETMFKFLLSYGYDYAIREIRLDLVNKLFMCSTDNLAFLTTINTQITTGVDEAKLNDIWISKMKTEKLENRMEDLTKIKSNYENIIKELAEKFKNLNKELNK